MTAQQAYQLAADSVAAQKPVPLEEIFQKIRLMSQSGYCFTSVDEPVTLADKDALTGMGYFVRMGNPGGPNSHVTFIEWNHPTNPNRP